jgi:hypothetical protein
MHNCIFIFCFAIIFSTLTLTQIRQSTQLDLSTHFYTSLLQKSQIEKNKKLEASFKHANTPKSTRKKHHAPNRLCVPTASGAKLNLYNLKNNKDLAQLYQQLILSLYKGQFNSADLRQIAHQTAQKITSSKEIECTQISDKRLQMIWYKMLKGAKSNPNKLPSLLDYCILNPQQKKAINYLQANYRVLIALLNESICQEILEQEKTNKRALKKAELLALCQKANHPTNKLEALVQYSSAKSIKTYKKTALNIA